MPFVKSLSSFFPKRARRPNSALEIIVTPSQALLASVVVFVAALWPMLTLRFGRPTSWFGDFLFSLCIALSLFAAPSLCIATFMDMLRRRPDARLVAAFLLALAGVVTFSAFIYLRIHQYDRAATGQ